MVSHTQPKSSSSLLNSGRSPETVIGTNPYLEMLNMPLRQCLVSQLTEELTGDGDIVIVDEVYSHFTSI